MMMVKLVNVKLMRSDQSQARSTKRATEQAKKFNWEWFMTIHLHQDQGVCRCLARGNAECKVSTIGAKYDHIKVKDDQGNYETTESIAIFEEYSVYLDEYPFNIGRINYKDNGARQQKNATYGVYSRKIKNAKYAGIKINIMVTAHNIEEGS